MALNRLSGKGGERAVDVWKTTNLLWPRTVERLDECVKRLSISLDDVALAA